MRVNAAAGWSVKLVGLALLLFLGIASQASAATIAATFTGTVKNAFDSTGVFGTPSANLAGADYTLVFTVDPTVGAYSTFNGTIVDPLLSGDQIFGGISALLTINGHSYAFQGPGWPSGNFDIAGTKPGSGLVAYQFQNSSTFAQVRGILSNDNPPGFPTSVFTAVSLTDCPSGTCTFSGSFIIPVVSPSGPFFNGSLNFGSFSVAVATTPLPATLPLLVSALGGLGFVGWRRKRIEAA